MKKTKLSPAQKFHFILDRRELNLHQLTHCLHRLRHLCQKCMLVHNVEKNSLQQLVVLNMKYKPTLKRYTKVYSY